MTNYDDDDVPVYHVSEEDAKYFEEEEHRINVLLRQKKTKRAEPLKDLMRNRTTVEQGLTLWQIFKEVYPDIVEKQRITDPDPSCNLLWHYHPRYFKYMRNLVKHVRKTDDDFRWLSPIPCRDERGKIKEYRYVNIKARNPDGSDSKLLEEVNEFWSKRIHAQIEASERKIKKLEMLAKMTEEQHEKELKLYHASYDYERSVLDFCEKKKMNELIGELKAEGKLPKLSMDYEPDYKKITNVVRKELLNRQIMLRRTWLTSEGKLPKSEMIRQSVKDAVAIWIGLRE